MIGIAQASITTITTPWIKGKTMKPVALIVLLSFALPSFACTKHDSYDAWFKKGLIKVHKDQSITCDAAKLGIKNCADAMPYIYYKQKIKQKKN